MSDAWQPFTAFQVYSDHVPMDGFRLVVRLVPDMQSMAACISERAKGAGPLDPVFSQAVIRAGVALAQIDGIDLVYASAQECTVVLSRGSVSMVGQSMLVHDFLVSRYAARLARLTEREIAVSGMLFEVPNDAVVRKALSASLNGVEVSAPWRAALYVGSQVLGRGGSFDPTSIGTLQGQRDVLAAAQVDLEALPAWWRRGLAARNNVDSVELFDQIPDGDSLGQLLLDS